MTTKKKPVTTKTLQTWNGLNAALMSTTSEKTCDALIREEKSGRKRPQFLKRIHSRKNKLRADREREELKG